MYLIALAAVVAATLACEPPSPAGAGNDSLPAINGDTVGLRLERVSAGSGDVLVSSGIPLTPGLLRPDATARVALLVGGREQAIYIEPLASRHRDGSLRAILVQFRHPLTRGTPVNGLLVIGPSVRRTTTDLPKAAIAAMPAAVALPRSAEYLVRTELVGPTVTVAQSPFAAYESNFVRYGNEHWAKESGVYSYGYYERPLAWFAYWVRSGNSEYWRRGMIDVLAYRDQFAIPNGWYMQPHWTFLEAIGIHYLLTGDETDRSGIGRAADEPFHQWWLPQLQLPQPDLEARIAARTLLTFLLAWRYDAPSAAGHNWQEASRQTLNHLLNHQGPDGSWKFRGTYNEQYNFMAGLLMDALIKYWEWFEPDPRIPPSVQRTLDYTWDTQWLAASQAFRYASGESPLNDPPGSTPAPDLNLLICHAFSWFYSLEPGSRASYKTRSDQCFNGGVAGTWLEGDKQFNQSYYLSFRHLAYRR